LKLANLGLTELDRRCRGRAANTSEMAARAHRNDVDDAVATVHDHHFIFDDKEAVISIARESFHEDRESGNFRHVHMGRLAALVGCGHVMRRGWPLALMLCADQVPVKSAHLIDAVAQVGCPDHGIDLSALRAICPFQSSHHAESPAQSVQAAVGALRRSRCQRSVG
jgi:hypothetical protein